MAPGGPLWPSLWTGTQGFSISLHSHSGLFSAAPGRINQLYLISFYTQINCHSLHSYEFPLISRNISPKLESFPPNCSALSAVTGRLHQDRWFLDHPNYFLKSLTKWSQMITSHQYGMWGFWNDSTYIVIIRKAVSRIPFWNICHICHLSDEEDIYGWKWEFISSPDCQSDHWFNLAPFVAAPERARWAIRGQNHCNYSTLPVSPGNFLIYKF